MLFFSVFLFEKEALLLQSGDHAVERPFVRRAHGMQMDAAREVAQRPRLRVLQLVAEGIRVVARKDMQRRRDLAVDRMLDRHIDRRAAQIDDRVQLLAQPVVIVMRDDAPEDLQAEKAETRVRNRRARPAA